MPITNNSKQTLKQEIAKLEDNKSFIVNQINLLDERRAKLIARRQELTQAINDLKADSNG